MQTIRRDILKIVKQIHKHSDKIDNATTDNTYKKAIDKARIDINIRLVSIDETIKAKEAELSELKQTYETIKQYTDYITIDISSMRLKRASEIKYIKDRAIRDALINIALDELKGHIELYERIGINTEYDMSKIEALEALKEV